MKVVAKSFFWVCLFGFVPLGLFFAGCAEEYRVLDEGEHADAAVRLENFRRESVTVDGTPEWRMQAGESFLYLQAQGDHSRLIARDFRFEQFNKQGAAAGVLVAKLGEINYEAGELELRGEVVFTQAKRTIRAAAMSYEIEAQILRSDLPVVIEEGGGVTRCRKGVVFELENERQTCKKPALVRSGGSDDAGGEEDFVDIFN